VLEVPLDKLPLFVKRGSIIPMLPLMNYTNEFPADTLILAVYPLPGSEAYFSLYEDDGFSLDYQSGSYALTEFRENISPNDELNILIHPSIGNYTGKLSERIYLSEVHHIGNEPTFVYRNGIMMSKRNSYNELRNNPEGYFHDDNKSLLYVQIKAKTDSLYQITAEGITINVEDGMNLSLKDFALYQNYPNPFNSSTTIKYFIPSSGLITLKVYDILGNEVATLVDEYKPTGSYEVEFDASGLSSGVYFYKMQAGAFIQTKKMILLR
jgi:hypothetical protein